MDNKELHCHPITPAPEWLRRLAPKGRVNAKDLAELFGYKNAGSLHAAVHAGNFPPADVETTASTAQGIHTPESKRCWWSRKVVVAEYNRRVKLFSKSA